MVPYFFSKRTAVILSLAVLCCLSGFDSNAANAATVSAWPMFHHDAQHTGQSSNNGPQTNTLKWSYSASSGNSSNGNTPPDTPSISNDGLTLYTNVSGLNGVAGTHWLVALSTANGQIMWSQSLGGGGATAVGADGTVYAVGGTQLYAFTSAGTLKWTYSGATDTIHGEPCIGADGTIYFGSWDTYVYAANSDGTLKWKYQTAGAIAPLASPTLSTDGLTLYVGSGDPHKQTDGTLYAILTSNGTLKWSKKIDTMRSSGAVVGQDGTVYACGSGRINAFTPDGTQLWQSASGTAEYLTPALSSSGIIYTGTGSTGKIFALNASTGATLWSYQTGVNPNYPTGPQYGVLTAPVIGADATVYVGSVDGKMYAVKSDGTLLWTYSTSSTIEEDCPAIGADGTLYFSSSNTYLYAVKDNTTTYTLSVSKSGTGSGTITSSPSGISCGSTCSASYTSGTSVLLTAAADSSSNFSGWTGCDNTSGSQCTVSMSASKSVSAVFTASASSSYTLSVSKSGTGSGTITSSPSGISCGSTCSASYTSGTSVLLTATAVSGSNFSSWTGCDNTSGSQCTVSMSANKSASAVFTASASSSYTLSVSKSGTGSGTITSSPSGISCGSTCSASYTSGTSVLLTATAVSGSNFSSWTGCDNTSGSQCTVSMSANRSASSVFTTAASSDNATASAAIDAVYAQYASWFGTKSGGVYTYTSGSTPYYVQWYSNGAALVAGTDGYMYTYYNGQWYGLGIIWQTLGKAATGITAIYNQYASWFGTRSGSIYILTSGSATYYVQWFSNGAAVVAWTDGYMYTYYNSTSYALGVSWR